jgi:hypothetical protein
MHKGQDGTMSIMMLQSVLSDYTYGDSHSSHDIFEINIEKDHHRARKQHTGAFTR